MLPHHPSACLSHYNYLMEDSLTEITVPKLHAIPTIIHVPIHNAPSLKSTVH